jgi:hypothetical protein
MRKRSRTAGGAAALGDRPHDQRLAALHVTCGEDPWNAGHPILVSLVRFPAIPPSRAASWCHPSTRPCGPPQSERNLHFETARKNRASSVRADALVGLGEGGGKVGAVQAEARQAETSTRRFIVKCEYQRRIVRRAMARSHFVS